MTDEEYAAQKERLRTLTERWVAPLGLRWWRLDLEYDREGIRVSDEEHAENWRCLFRVFTRWEYAEAKIVCNMPALADLDDERLEEKFVHELVHVLVNEMREEGHCHEERVVTTLTKAFLWVRDMLGPQAVPEGEGGLPCG